MGRPKKEVGKLNCPKCNYAIEDNDIYCESCGYNLLSKKETVKEKSDDNINNVQYEVPKFSTPNKQQRFIVLYILGAILLVLTGAGGMYILKDYISSAETTIKNIGSKNVNITDTGIAEAVDKVYDSVVVVENYKNETLTSTGTGFVYKKDSKNGYILTNNHVVDGSTTVYVTFTNGKREKASLVGSDAYSDVALLKVDDNSVISVAETGKSKDVRLGDTTFAIGAPLDYQVYSWSVTRGILSGKNRLVEVSLSNSNTSDYVMEVLQTDTAINSGNSGGPLCNANGEVIGITNMKLASSSVEGMGFAIPIETAVEYAEMFINGKTITRPYLGIAMYDLSAIQNSFYRLDIDTDLNDGVYVYSVENGSSAEKAGLKSGDIITKMDDIEIKSSAYLRYNLYQHNVGDKIKITYYRNKKESTITITLSSSGKSI